MDRAFSMNDTNPGPVPDTPYGPSCLPWLIKNSDPGVRTDHCRVWYFMKNYTHIYTQNFKVEQSISMDYIQ